MSFGLALMLIQASPADFVYRSMESNTVTGTFLRLIMYSACALYRLRKFTFIVHTTRMLGNSPWMLVFLCVLSSEGSSVLRFIENQTCNMRWHRGSARRALWILLTGGLERLFLGANFWLSIVATAVLYGSADASSADGPLLFPLKRSSKMLALGILILRYNRKTLKQAVRMVVKASGCCGDAAAAPALTAEATPRPRARSGSNSSSSRGSRSNSGVDNGRAGNVPSTGDAADAKTRTPASSKRSATRRRSKQRIKIDYSTANKQGMRRRKQPQQAK